MKQTLILLILFLFVVNLFGRTSYTGYIDKYPIELITNIYSEDVTAFYVYKKFLFD